MKILTDAGYVTLIPLSLLPLFAAHYLKMPKVFRKIIQCVFQNKPKNIFRNTYWCDPYNKRAFSDKRFDGIDLNLTISGANLFKDESNRINLRGIKCLRDKNRNICAFHLGHEYRSGPFRHMSVNLACNSPLTREKLANQLKAVKLLAHEKHPIAVCHPGSIRDNKGSFREVLKTVEFLAKKAEEQGIYIALENMPVARVGQHFGGDYRQLLVILKEIQSPNLGICFDWGHANHYAREFLKINTRGNNYLKNFGYQREIIEALNEKIIYAHIHYNNCHKQVNISDEHLPLTKISESESETYAETIKDLVNKTAIKRHGKILLEVFPRRVYGFYPFWPTGATKSEICQSAEILRDMIEK